MRKHTPPPELPTVSKAWNRAKRETAHLHPENRMTREEKVTVVCCIGLAIFVAAFGPAACEPKRVSKPDAIITQLEGDDHAR